MLKVRELLTARFKYMHERPEYLESFLRELIIELDGFYRRDFYGVMKSHRYSVDELRGYLGTYFPRSFWESYDVSNAFFRKIFFDKFSDGCNLKILDVGCGMGGAFFGFMFSLLENFAIYTLVVDGLDANQESLHYFEKIIESRAFAKAREMQCQTRMPGAQCLLRKSLKTCDLNEQKFNVLEDERFYDVILSSKMLNEFDDDSAYETFLRFYLPRLTESGVCIVIDVNYKKPDGFLYVSQLFSSEVISFLNSNKEFKCAVPPACSECVAYKCRGFNQSICERSDYDRTSPGVTIKDSKYCYRIFCREKLFEKLKGRLIEFDYKANDNVICPRLS